MRPSTTCRRFNNVCYVDLSHLFTPGMILFLHVAFTITTTHDSQAHDNAAFSLLLPGRILYLCALLVQTEFRGIGNKAGALSGWNFLQEAYERLLHFNVSVTVLPVVAWKWMM